MDYPDSANSAAEGYRKAARDLTEVAQTAEIGWFQALVADPRPHWLASAAEFERLARAAEGDKAAIAGIAFDTVVMPMASAALISGKPSATGTVRLPQDANVNPRAPGALPTNRPIGLSPTQNAEAQRIVADLRARGFTDIRVNQQQVNALGSRVGINRPDIQATSPGGQRVHYELDTASSNRGAGHETRIKANDPAAQVLLRTVN